VIIWTKYRGPGWVSIDDERLELRNNGDSKKVMQAGTEAWFDQPGEYWLRAQVNDSSGDGGRGEQCCWTTAQLASPPRPAAIGEGDVTRGSVPVRVTCPVTDGP
jgi:hypothetical protein